MGMIYIVLFISILILYVALKHKTLSCEKEEKQIKEEVKPVKVSDIFKDMFDLPEPRPGNIGII